MRSPCLPPVFCPGSRWFTRGWWTLNSWSCGRTWCGRRAKRRGSNQVMRNSKNHQKGTMICELVCNIYVICNIYIYYRLEKNTDTHTPFSLSRIRWISAAPRSRPKSMQYAFHQIGEVAVGLSRLPPETADVSQEHDLLVLSKAWRSWSNVVLSNCACAVGCLYLEKIGATMQKNGDTQ